MFHCGGGGFRSINDPASLPIYRKSDLISKLKTCAPNAQFSFRIQGRISTRVHLLLADVVEEGAIPVAHFLNRFQGGREKRIMGRKSGGAFWENRNRATARLLSGFTSPQMKW